MDNIFSRNSDKVCHNCHHSLAYRRTVMVVFSSFMQSPATSFLIATEELWWWLSHSKQSCTYGSWYQVLIFVASTFSFCLVICQNYQNPSWHQGGELHCVVMQYNARATIFIIFMDNTAVVVKFIKYVDKRVLCTISTTYSQLTRLQRS